MKERSGDTSKEGVTQVNLNAKHEDKIATQGKMARAAKSASMPNPVRGLRLSLYPIIKEH
jgi:hypothetical protein